jgi:hypothetical protein
LFCSMLLFVGQLVISFLLFDIFWTYGVFLLIFVVLFCCKSHIV